MLSKREERNKENGSNIKTWIHTRNKIIGERLKDVQELNTYHLSTS